MLYIYLQFMIRIQCYYVITWQFFIKNTKSYNTEFQYDYANLYVLLIDSIIVLMDSIMVLIYSIVIIKNWLSMGRKSACDPSYC